MWRLKALIAVSQAFAPSMRTLWLPFAEARVQAIIGICGQFG
jgi:hypothetical protein